MTARFPLNTALALLLAVFLHLWVMTISPGAFFESSRELKEKWVELWERTPSPAERKPIVETESITKSLPSDKPARFHSSIEQRVEKETRAPLAGRFYQARPRPTVPAEGGERSLSDFMALGSTPNALPEDIAEGGHTVLNTDKVVYASYFTRIADEVYQPWVNGVEKVFRDFNERQRELETNLYVTRLQLILDASGEVKAIKLARASGIEGLDEACRSAIWQRDPFPNPPRQLIDETGMVQLNYEFQVEVKKSGFNIVPWRL